MRYRYIILVLAVILSGCTTTKAYVDKQKHDLPVAESKLGIVRLDSGLISGTSEGQISEYLGIPYAAPPIGELRWRPPQKVAAWKGLRSCEWFAPACVQSKSKHEIRRMSEDCLYLNIWTPAKRTDEGLPVMFWIHGGAFRIGSGSFKEFQGKNLAKKGVIVVTINYRIGPLGFLAHPLLRAESEHEACGNYGLLDQIAALEWVKRNISGFGGDPNRVTIFGESAGGASVTALMISPLAKGLFSQAISESGTLFGDRYFLPKANGSLAQALKSGVNYAKALGCDKADDVLAALRKKSAADLIEAAKNFQFGPVFDDWVIPQYPEITFSSGAFVQIPLIIGVNGDEGSLWFKKDRAKAAQFGLDAFVKPAYFIAGCVKKTFFYHFSRAPATEMGKQFGSYHAAEVSYVFGTLDKSRGYNEVDFTLSEKMMNYWVNFVKTGDPNGPGLPHWPAYNNKSQEYLEL